MGTSSMNEVNEGLARRFGAVPAGLLLAVFFALPLGALLVGSAARMQRRVPSVRCSPMIRWWSVRSVTFAGAGGGRRHAVAGGRAAACDGAGRTAAAAARLVARVARCAVGVFRSGDCVRFHSRLRPRRLRDDASSHRLGADPATVGALIYTTAGLVAAYAYYLIPRVALMLYPAIANLDRRPIEAALTLGASPWRALFDVALRELWPSIAAAWCLVTSIALGNLRYRTCARRDADSISCRY